LRDVAPLFVDGPQIEHVYNFQRNSSSSGYKIVMLNRGESPLKGEEPGFEELLGTVVGAGKFSCTADFAGCDAVTLAIQTSFLDERDGSGTSGATSLLGQPHASQPPSGPCSSGSHSITGCHRSGAHGRLFSPTEDWCADDLGVPHPGRRPRGTQRRERDVLPSGRSVTTSRRYPCRHRPQDGSGWTVSSYFVGPGVWRTALSREARVQAELEKPSGFKPRRLTCGSVVPPGPRPSADSS
jgi:hypothetical protein